MSDLEQILIYVIMPAAEQINSPIGKPLAPNETMLFYELVQAVKDNPEEEN